VSSAATKPPADENRASVSPSVPLDEVMLAMDVVDTLRHQRAQIEAELDEDKREQQLIARIRSIYESQGMDVPADVIAQGVRALVEDRFIYEPPRRSFGVRLAEVYVHRGRWALRIFIVALVAAAVWAAIAIPVQQRRQDSIESFRMSLLGLVQTAGDLDRRTTRLVDRVDAAGNPKSLDAAKRILGAAARVLVDSQTSLERLHAELVPGPDPESYPDAPSRLDAALDEYRGSLDRVKGDLDAVTGQLEALRSLTDLRAQASSALAPLDAVPVPDGELRALRASQASVLVDVDAGRTKVAWQGLRALNGQVASYVRSHARRQSRVKELARLRSRLNGVQLDSSTRTELQSLVASVESAIQGNDSAAATRDLTRLASLVALLDRSYELRIATGRGKRSGVWRNTPGRKKNYYIVVEPISTSGRRLKLRIKNEESGRSQTVSIFAVRVPKKVYDQIGADKADNGIIEDRLFGVKRRGARETEYRFPVSGGMITRW
jgi:Family of unknown function (DUF6384)